MIIDRSVPGFCAATAAFEPRYDPGRDEPLLAAFRFDDAKRTLVHLGHLPLAVEGQFFGEARRFAFQEPMSMGPQTYAEMADRVVLTMVLAIYVLYPSLGSISVRTGRAFPEWPIVEVVQGQEVLTKIHGFLPPDATPAELHSL